jgi:O-antigen ligase
MTEIKGEFPLRKITPNILLEKGYFSYFFALLAVIILPIHVKYIPPVMIIWGICWIVENYFRINMIWTSRKAIRILFGLFILYYAWQVVGLVYTSDIRMGFLNLFGRLSLVLFPLVLILPGEAIKTKVKALNRVFAVSTFLFMLFCFIYAFYRSLKLNDGFWNFNAHPTEYPWLSYFYGSYLTISQHPSYIAMYVLLSAFICFESLFDKSLKFIHRILWIIIGSLLLVSQYFLSSRAGILISLMLVPLYLIIKFKEIGKKRFSWLWIILILIGLLPIILTNKRMDYLYGRTLRKQIGYERKEDPRIIIWKSAFRIAKKNMLFGVGIGDVRTVLAHEYERIGEEKMANERFNSHNQLLEVLLENGIIGLVLFISIFICMFYISFSDKNLLYGMFILMLFLFFLFETVLYRLAGISFFSLFSFLLIYQNSSKHELEVDTQPEEE